ncbi:MAG: hypothetical protein WCT02_00995 [Candidatus Paceibacterota bacterium]
MRTRNLFLIAASIFLISGALAQAQGVPVVAGLVLTASIDNPNPGQKVTVQVQSYSADINSATLTWTLNGKVIQKGVGLTSIDLITPAVGGKLILNVSAVTVDGTNLNSSLTFISGSVDIITENDGYAPPLFKGKLPVSYQNSVRFIAVPHLADSSGKEYDPKTLVYQWKKNNQALQDQSGFNRQYLVLESEIVPRPYSVAVTVSTRDGSVRAAAFATVSFASPSIVFYADDPLYGPLFNYSIRDSIIIGSQRETGVLAVPLGFNKPLSGIGDLGLTWLINGIEHPELTTNQSIILRAPDNTAGTSNITLSVRNNKNILQGADSGFSAIFSSDTSSQ